MAANDLIGTGALQRPQKQNACNANPNPSRNWRGIYCPETFRANFLSRINLILCEF